MRGASAPVDPAQIENRCDAADLMIMRNGRRQGLNALEQLLLPTLQSSHHRPPSVAHAPQATESLFANMLNADFCNTIGQQEKWLVATLGRPNRLRSVSSRA